MEVMAESIRWEILSEKCLGAGLDPSAFLREKLVELQERKRILVTPARSWYRDNALKYDSLAEKLLARPLRDDERRVSKSGLASLVERRLNPEEREQLAADSGLKQRLLDEAGGRCNVCGKELKLKTMEIDHRLPLAEGGSNDSLNLQALCRQCNQGKADYFEETAFAAARPWWERRGELVDGSVSLTDLKRYCALIRAGKRCQQCGTGPQHAELRVVLRVTSNEGGQPVFDNLIAVCPTCSGG